MRNKRIERLSQKARELHSRLQMFLERRKTSFFIELRKDDGYHWILDLRNVSSIVETTIGWGDPGTRVWLKTEHNDRPDTPITVVYPDFKTIGIRLIRIKDPERKLKQIAQIIKER